MADHLDTSCDDGVVWHFDHVASPDIRGMDVHAFQRLWNRNHPEDPIDEDGVYGPNTDARLAQAPAEGFPIGTCLDETPGTGEGEDPAGEGDEDPTGEGDEDPTGEGEDQVGGDLSAGCAAGGAGASSGLGLLLVLAALGRAGAIRRRRVGTGTTCTGASVTAGPPVP